MGEEPNTDATLSSLEKGRNVTDELGAGRNAQAAWENFGADSRLLCVR